MTSNAIKYQSEIDGLRALAVAPVLLYHARIEAPAGSYLAGGFWASMFSSSFPAI